MVCVWGRFFFVCFLFFNIWTSNCSSTLIVQLNVRRMNGIFRLYVLSDGLINKTNDDKNAFEFVKY